jgi:DNA-binding PadR family transcriptional regulator
VSHLLQATPYAESSFRRLLTRSLLLDDSLRGVLRWDANGVPKTTPETRSFREANSGTVYQGFFDSQPISAQKFFVELISSRMSAAYTVDCYSAQRYSNSHAMYDTKPDSLLPLPTAVFHILIALADRDRHGYSIMQDVAARTGGKVQLSAGTLYSSIRRMLEQGLIEELKESPDPSSTDERRRYYRLTRFGKRVAAAEVERLTALLREARATGLVSGV